MFNDAFKEFPKDVDLQKLREKLFRFYKKYYIGNLITLVIISNRDKNELRN